MSYPDDFFDAQESQYKLRLFVAGSSSISTRAINNLQEILEAHLKDKYDLQIIDVHQQPDLIGSENITALPMLIKSLPLPKRLLVGDMSDTAKVLRGLNLF